MLVPSIIYNCVKKAEAFDKMPSSASNPRGQEHLLSCLCIASLCQRQRHHSTTCNNNNTNNHRRRYWLSSSSWIRWLKLQVVAVAAANCLFAFVSASAASIIIVLTIIVRFYRSESSRTSHRQIELSDKLRNISISWLLAFRPSSSIGVLHHSLIHPHQRICWRITSVSSLSLPIPKAEDNRDKKR